MLGETPFPCCSELCLEHLEQGVRGALTFRVKLTLKELWRGGRQEVRLPARYEEHSPFMKGKVNFASYIF